MYRFILVSIFMALSACTTSSKFERVGYKKPVAAKGSVNQCKVYLTFQKNFEHKDFKKLGMIEAVEPGAGIACQEDLVLSQFITDTCELGGNVVNIIEESHPNFWSTCYRAHAELLKVNNLKELKTAEKYQPKNITKRSQNGHSKTQQAISAGIISGVFQAIVLD